MTCATESALTRAQTLILAGQALCPTAPLYNMALLFEIDGPIDFGRFARCVQSVVNHSDSLRTTVHQLDGVAVQRVLKRLDANLQFIDLSGEDDADFALQDWAHTRCKRSFSLAERSFDTALIKLTDSKFAWYYNQHHVLTDASSFKLIYDAVRQHYQSQGDEVDSLTLPPYSDYVEYERGSRERIEASRNWFRKKQSFSAPKLYGVSPNVPTTATRRVTLRLGQDRSQQLRLLAQEDDVRSLTLQMSLFNLFATLLFAFLYRVSGQRDLAIGAPSHNRSRRSFKETIGLFIEVFPLSTQISSDDSFDAVAEKLKPEIANYLRYAQPGASDGRDQKCFNTLLNYITASFGDFCGYPMKSQWLHSGHCDPGHHLRLQVHDFDDAGEFVLHFDFNESVFDQAKQARAASHFLRLVDALLQDRFQLIDAVELLSDEEKRRLLSVRSAADHIERPTVVEKFRRQVAATPDSEAMVDGDRTWTYRELDLRIDALACRLKQIGVGSQDRVGFCLRRSPAAVVAIMAILRAGAAYVPIDPRNPARRNAFIIEDTAAAFVLTDRKLRDRLPDSTQVLFLDHDGNLDADNQVVSFQTKPADNLRGSVAYLIYTSGSTGVPKGVVISHQALSHYIEWAEKKYVRGRALAFPLFSPLTFDLTVTSIFLPLVTGGQIVIYPEPDGPSDLAILDVIQQNRVDIIKLTPSHLALLKNEAMQGSRVEQWILGGEDLTCSLARRIHDAFDGRVEIHNEYGPTEATVGCIVHTFDPTRDTDASVPIGKAIDRMQALVLNDQLQPVPQGVPGELFLAGDGLADGYWNRDEMTSERFLPHPFQSGKRIYRTGDLARVRDDGVMEFHGRIDRQIKVRGVRMELGDIEAAMTLHPNTTASAVKLAAITSSRQIDSDDLQHCIRCGLPSNYPDVIFDDEGQCHLCTKFETYKERANLYFRSMDDLRDLFDASKANGSDATQYDCLALLSGGKDSTYMLGRLVDMNLRIMAFTLDNGFISEQAKANIKRVVETLGVDHVFASTPVMNAIFVDSLNRHANVCQGCFKTIYTLSLQYAHQHRIPLIVTGLSRGQFFETRLTEELFTDPNIDVDQIDDIILRARKQYHRVDDAVSQLMDVALLQEDAVFEEIRFVDFYRYCDASLDQMFDYLRQRVPWIRPSDTGRSTNCLINDLGIHVHKRERGYHNYAFPYSWDVRIGHKTREAALQELDDEIDIDHVKRMMKEVGYQATAESGDSADLESNRERLVAYYVGAMEISHHDWVRHLSSELPDSMIPTQFIRIDSLPLSVNGKLDYDALPDAGIARPLIAAEYAPPETRDEKLLAEIWQQVLRVQRVGIDDNFFDLGGDSILAIQIISRANRDGLALVPSQLFDHLTVRELASVSGTQRLVAEQGVVTGEFPLLPIQRWYFDTPNESPPGSYQVLVVNAPGEIDAKRLERALQHVVVHHDALRVAFTGPRNERVATILGNEVSAIAVETFDVPSVSDFDARSKAIHEIVRNLCKQTNIEKGQLLGMAVLVGSDHANSFVIAAHHLAVDAVSWPIVLEDLWTTYERLVDLQEPELPAKTCSVKSWSVALHKYANSDALLPRVDDWRHVLAAINDPLPCDMQLESLDLQQDAETLSVEFDSRHTEVLLGNLAGKNHRLQEILLTALGIALASWTDQETVVIDVEGHGRESFDPNLDVSRTVGWFTTMYPLLLRVPRAESAAEDPRCLAEIYAAVRDRVRSVPKNGFEFGLLKYLANPANHNPPIDFAAQPQVLFNYLGRAEQVIPPTAPLTLDRELSLWTAPESVRRHPLEVNAMFVKDKLRVDWTHNRRRHNTDTIIDLSNTFFDNLIALVNICANDSAQEVTPSDFPEARLDEQKLDKLAALLKKVDSKGARP